MSRFCWLALSLLGVAQAGKRCNTNSDCPKTRKKGRTTTKYKCDTGRGSSTATVCYQISCIRGIGCDDDWTICSECDWMVVPGVPVDNDSLVAAMESSCATCSECQSCEPTTNANVWTCEDPQATCTTAEQCAGTVTPTLDPTRGPAGPEVSPTAGPEVSPTGPTDSGPGDTTDPATGPVRRLLQNVGDTVCSACNQCKEVEAKVCPCNTDKTQAWFLERGAACSLVRCYDEDNDLYMRKNADTGEWEVEPTTGPTDDSEIGSAGRTHLDVTVGLLAAFIAGAPLLAA
jgi:hypothetical protein